MTARKKWVRVLQALVDRSSLNRFEAERDPAIRDHVLPSTVAELQIRRQIRVDRKLVELPGYAGERTLVAAYSLDMEQRERAMVILRDVASRGT